MNLKKLFFIALARKTRILVFGYFILALIPFIFTHSPVSINAQGKQDTQTQAMSISGKELDQRALILRDYLAEYNSPLSYHAQDFIDAADIYKIDWKLVPAISGVESTFGKHIPGGHNPRFISYNGWGWGVYGPNILKFRSWREGIFTVTGGLKKDYIDKGLVEPLAMNRKYAASKTWGVRVAYFINDLEKFSKKYQLDSTSLLYFDYFPKQNNFVQLPLLTFNKI